MADRKIGNLNQEVTRLKEELSLQADSVYTLKAQVYGTALTFHDLLFVPVKDLKG